MGEVVPWLQRGDVDADVAVRAAMAHLHVISVHPFRDGNGGVSASFSRWSWPARLSLPEFFSIEEYLRANTQPFYAALQEVQAGSLPAGTGRLTWVEFCVEAHIAQAGGLGADRRAAALVGLKRSRSARLARTADDRARQSLLGGSTAL